MPSDLQTIVSDPDFAKLSDTEKQAVIGRVDPSFNQLAAGDRATVLSRLSGPSDVRSQIAARKANPPPTATGDPNAQESWLGALGHPVEAGEGFLGTVAGGVKALAHPVDTFKSDMAARGAAYDRMKQRGMMTDDPEQLRDAAEYALPLVGPAFANAGREMNSPNSHVAAHGFGSGLALVAGPEMVKDAVGVLPTQEAAIAQMQRVIDPKGANPTLARSVAERLVNQRKVMTNPPVDLAADAEARLGPQNSSDPATANGRLNHAISQSAPVDANSLANGITDARRAQFRPTGTPAAVGPQQMAPRGPDSLSTVAAIDKYNSDVVEPNAANGGQIPADAARELRQNFDNKAAARGAFDGKTNLTSDTQARASIGNALRGELNKDPNVATANREVGTELDTKDLADAIPAPKPLNVGRRLAVLGVDAALPHGNVFGDFARAIVGGGAAASLIYDVMRSPAWKTWSAVQKSKFAALVNAGDLGNAARMASQGGIAASGGERDMSAPELSRVLGQQ